MHYHHVLGAGMPGGGRPYFSSAELAELLHIDDTLVRKDFAVIGLRGIPRRGYPLVAAQQRIAEALGFDRRYRAVLVGAGALGSALAHYDGFSAYGLQLVGIFDCDVLQIGRRIGRLVVQPMTRLATTLRRRAPTLGILAVPVPTAQGVAEQLVDGGIRTLWNFAPTRLLLPEEVFVRHEHISVGLGELAHHLKAASSAPVPS